MNKLNLSRGMKGMKWLQTLMVLPVVMLPLSLTSSKADAVVKSSAKVQRRAAKSSYCGTKPSVLRLAQAVAPRRDNTQQGEGGGGGEYYSNSRTETVTIDNLAPHSRLTISLGWQRRPLLWPGPIFGDRRWHLDSG